MEPSGVFRCVALVNIDVSEERIASIRVQIVGELGTVMQLLVTTNFPGWPILVTLLVDAIRSSEMSALTRATRRSIPGHCILHSYRRENINS
jgi:hypothetical protein